MNLTVLLAIAGGLVLVAVLIHGLWTARKAGPRRAAPPIEPTLGGSAADRTEPAWGRRRPPWPSLCRAGQQLRAQHG